MLLPFVDSKRTSDNQWAHLILDGSSVHTALNSISFCFNHGIVATIPPAHTSDLVQVHDVALFGTLKEKIRTVLHWRTEQGLPIGRGAFSAICDEARTAAINPANVFAGL